MATPSTPTEPFPPAPDGLPSTSPAQQSGTPRSPADSNAGKTSPISPRRARGSSAAASIASSVSSRLQTILDADLPPGFMAATGSAASKAPTITDIRSGSFGSAGWDEQAQKRTRRSSAGEDAAGNKRRLRSSSQNSSKGPVLAAGSALETFPPLKEEETAQPAAADLPNLDQKPAASRESPPLDLKDEFETRKSTISYDGPSEPQDHAESSSSPEPYTVPPPLPWKTSFMIGLRTYLKWVVTIPGFLITIYGLNVVAWGGMLFLLLCNAAPAMCNPTCDDINSPRRIWIEIDSQILNALFCVTGFGLAPWRFRDLYWWAVWRLGKQERGIRKLAGIHRDWFRLRGSDAPNSNPSQGELPSDHPAMPIPASKAPPAPLTGVRAPPTAPWKMDWAVWMMVLNTFLQVVLSGFMWGLNRYDRPSWSTGLFVALGIITAALGGLMIFFEGKNVKKVEGVRIGREERKARGWPLEDEESAVETTVDQETKKSKNEKSN